ncbi:MAG: hypothetical protein QW424_01120 [Candidatus Bathyarchaeia archaeon]
MITNIIHCRDEEPDLCGRKIRKIAECLTSSVPRECKLLMIGFQPAIAYNLSRIFENFRVTDMDPANIRRVKRGVLIKSYEKKKEAIKWSDIIVAKA